MIATTIDSPELTIIAGMAAGFILAVVLILIVRMLV